MRNQEFPIISELNLVALVSNFDQIGANQHF